MIAFVDDHRDVHGVEPICRLLPIASSTYHAHRARQDDLSRLPARTKRDAELRVEIARVHAENFGVYGARRSGGSSTGRALMLLAAQSKD